MYLRELISFDFKNAFGREPELISYAPGRVNLIGEHTDYNGGHVLPCALEFGIYCAAAQRGDGKVLLRSSAFSEGGTDEYELEGGMPERSSWTVYPMGVLRALADAGIEIKRGADMAFLGNIPSGSGLSSSAALEVAAALALCALNGIELDRTKLALICQRAENIYAGVNCGIMDQFASACGMKDHAVFLDTATLEHEYVPLELGEAELVVVNSKCKHSLAGSEYNVRRQQCEEALKLLSPVTGKSALCHITPEEFEACKGVVTDPVLIKRARHAVSEEARTLAACAALKGGDIARFGRLMNESHISLRDDYEVSCRELDILTELAWSCPYVLGARMTGGGFGGCMVCIVEKERADEFRAKVEKGYYEATGLTAEFYFTSPADGAKLL